jgi:hypothetical protein
MFCNASSLEMAAQELVGALVVFMTGVMVGGRTGANVVTMGLRVMTTGGGVPTVGAFVSTGEGVEITGAIVGTGTDVTGAIVTGTGAGVVTGAVGSVGRELSMDMDIDIDQFISS